jgi:hypothetical protein
VRDDDDRPDGPAPEHGVGKDPGDGAHEGAAPEADLVAAPADQRSGDEPEDLLRSTDEEVAAREHRRKGDS